MIHCNVRGSVMVIAGLASGFAAGGLASLFTPDEVLHVVFGTLVALPIPTVWDLVYRWSHRRELGWWRYLIPDAGGNSMYLPVWVMFGGAPVIGILWAVGQKVGRVV